MAAVSQDLVEELDGEGLAVLVKEVVELGFFVHGLCGYGMVVSNYSVSCLVFEVSPAFLMAVSLNLVVPT